MKKFTRAVATLLILSVSGCMNDDKTTKHTEHTEQTNQSSNNTQIVEDNQNLTKNNQANPNEVKENDVNLDDLDTLVHDVQMIEHNKQDAKLDASLDPNSAWKEQEISADDKTSAKMITRLLERGFNEDLNRLLFLEQEKCFGKLNLSASVNEVDTILRKQLSASEFNNLTRFIKSDLGQKFPQYADYLLKYRTTILSVEDKRNLRAYAQSPEGRYLKKLRFNKDFTAMLKRKTDKKLKSCDIHQPIFQ